MTVKWKRNYGWKLLMYYIAYLYNRNLTKAIDITVYENSTRNRPYLKIMHF